jgi:hypothetical protein
MEMNLRLLKHRFRIQSQSNMRVPDQVFKPRPLYEKAK